MRGEHQALVDARARLNALYASRPRPRPPPPPRPRPAPAPAPGNMYVTGPAEHTAGQFAVVLEALTQHANIQVHLDKNARGTARGENLRDSLMTSSPPQDPENPCRAGHWALQLSSKVLWIFWQPRWQPRFHRLENPSATARARPPVAADPASAPTAVCIAIAAVLRSDPQHAPTQYLLRTLPPADQARALGPCMYWSQKGVTKKQKHVALCCRWHRQQSGFNKLASTAEPPSNFQRPGRSCSVCTSKWSTSRLHERSGGQLRLWRYRLPAAPHAG